MTDIETMQYEYIEKLKDTLKEVLLGVKEIDRELQEHANPFLESAIQRTKGIIRESLKEDTE